jgi:5-methylcytosine-specific restriction enzyme subunit McrC
MLNKIELNEYEVKRERTPEPTRADIQLAEQLSSDVLKPKITIRWLSTGEIDISATSWVGVIQFSHVEIHVVPKLVGGQLGVLRMLQYGVGIELVRRLPSERRLAAVKTNLLDLATLFLTEATKTLIRDGLLRDYRAVDDSLPALRGRLNIRDQYLRRFAQLDQLECHFDEYDGDVPETQLVAAALQVACRRVRDPDVRAAALRQAAIMGEVCEPPTRDAGWYERTIVYGRRNARYRSAHELSKLILRGFTFEDLYDTSAGHVSAFMFDMNLVFERFVTRLVQHALDGTKLRARAQPRLRAVIRNEDTGRDYSTVKPDLVIEETVTGHAVPVDIKYKLYADKKLSTSDIYQLFLYAYAHGTDDFPRRAGVIYPTTSSVTGPRLSIKPIAGPTAAWIGGAGLNVTGALDAIDRHEITALFGEVRNIVSSVTGFA